jgi:phenylalanyl-tRNA synthetase beta subunit
MRLSVNSVNSYLSRKLSTQEIVDALEKTEVEVEDVLLASKLDSNIVTAKVLKISKHPNADKLRLAEISFGNKISLVVCGAENLAVNMIVAYAQPKSVLPDGSKIEKAVIRGQKSAGMLCSAKELAISDDHAGILELDPSLPTGISLCDIESIGDVLDIKTPANRWDMLSIIGLAREVSANTDLSQIIEPKTLDIKYFDKKYVNVKEIGECSRFISARLSIAKSTTTPAWIVDNLEAAGLRSINSIVDITNFVMLETGQPSHAYDSSKLNGVMQVRFAKKGELLPTLDGVSRKLDKADLVIADSNGPIALAGVMGGASTEVDSSTTDILLEVANFDKTTVRRSALRHGIRTEASGRFEKGLPLPLQDFAMKRLLYLFETVCSAKIVDGPFDQLNAWPWIQFLGLRVRSAEKFLGTKIDEKKLVKGLKARGFSAEHFSLSSEANKHLGKPYLLGASFKQNGENEFDCSYLTERIYSKIGIAIGHTAKQQFDNGTSVEADSLRPGDLLFYSGHWDKISSAERGDIGHVGMVLAGNKVLEASQYEYDKKSKQYKKSKAGGVRLTQVENFTENPSYKGARRYTESFNHIIAVTCPWWRSDITIEQDLFEEAAKIVGYENITATLPQLPPTQTDKHQLVLKLDALRDFLVSQGFFEIMTYSFVSNKHLRLSGLSEDSHLKIINPLSIEQEFLRSSIMMSHIQVASNNRSYWQKEFTFFELSRVYYKDSTQKNNKRESWQLAITAIGEGSVSRLQNILRSTGQKYSWKSRIENTSKQNYIEGRCASLVVDGSSVGVFGQIKPSLLKNYKYSAEVSFLEISISEDLITPKEEVVEPVAVYSYIDRDFTIEVDRSCQWQSVIDALPKKNELIRLEFVSYFSDESLVSKNKKRLSFRVWLDCGSQPSQKQISLASDRVLGALKCSKSVGKYKLI